MKTAALLSAFVIAKGANTLTATHTIKIVHDTFLECEIEQCLNAEMHNTACPAAAAERCDYNDEVVVRGGMTDICYFPGAATETETPLWLKLDLSAARLDMAEWYYNCAYISGSLAFETANPSKSILSLTAYGSPSQGCDGSVDSKIGELAWWSTGSNRIEIKNTPMLLHAIVQGVSAIAMNGSSNGFTQAAVGSITGFTVENFEMHCTSTDVGTFPSVSELQGGDQSVTDLTGSCVDGCADKGSVVSVEACIAAAPVGCDFSATYTYRDGALRLNTCELPDDKRRVSKQLIFPSDMGQSSDIVGSVFLDIGSKPYEACQIEVSLLTGSLDMSAWDCGFPNAQIASKQTFTIDPETRTMELTQLPDNFAGVAVTADKDWRFCGGAINAVRVESLTAKLHITSKAPPPNDDPSDPPSDPSGSEATLTLAAVSFASLVFSL